MKAAIIVNGTPQQNKTLTITNSVAGEQYKWYRDDRLLTGTETSYTLTQADVGKNITVKYATDDSGQSNPLRILNTNDSPTGTLSITGSLIFKGTQKQGSVLSVKNTLNDIDGLGAFNYQWLRDGKNIAGETKSTHTLTVDDVQKTISVKVTYIDLQNTLESVVSSGVLITSENHPHIGTVTIQGKVQQNEILTADKTTLKDADGLGNITYHWLINGKETSHEPNYQLTQSEVGKTISLYATYTDQAGYSEQTDPTVEIKVLNVNDPPTGELSILVNNKPNVQTAIPNDVLNVSNTVKDIDGIGTLNYQWLRSGVPISGQTQTTYTLTNADLDKTISVKVSYLDLQGTSESVSATKSVLVNNQIVGDIVISGIAQQTKTLTINKPIANAIYHWYRDGTLIKVDGTVFENTSYTLTQGDVGTNITVSYKDGTHKTDPLRIANLNDSPTGTVNVLGIFKQGSELTADVQIIDVDGIGTDEKGNKIYNYQWLRDGVNIKGAISDKYTLTVDDVQKTVSVKVTYIDLQNKLETVLSSGVAIAEHKSTENHPHTGTVEIKGVAQQNKLLTVIDTLADVDGLGKVTYHWLLDGKEISTDPFYALTQNDVGKNISLYATYTDRSDHDETTEETAVLRVTNVNDPPTGTLSILVNDKLPNAQKAAQKDTLTVNNTLEDVDGIGIDKDGKELFKYQWLRDGAAIAGETGETHILTQADVNKIISVKASYIDLQGKKEDVISAGLSIDNVNDSPTGAVYITGVSNLGRTLSAAPQLIDLDGLGEMRYQWFRGETPISDATLSNYTLTQDDLKMQMSVTVAYTDGFGNQETASSQKMPLAVSTSTKMTIGSDYITGTSKAEKITGLSGDDTLIGGLGNDTLTGGLGNDVFLFNTEKEMNKDTIVDFKTGQDKIDISNMDGDMKTAGKQGFTFIGNDAPFVKNDAIGKLRFDSQKHILYGSNDADIQPEFSIVLTGVDSLESSDFIFTPAS